MAGLETPRGLRSDGSRPLRAPRTGRPGEESQRPGETARGRENDEDREHASAPATDQTWKRVRRPVSSDFQFWATKVSLTESVCVGGGGLDRDPGPKRHQNPRPRSHQLGAVGAVTP